MAQQGMAYCARSQVKPAAQVSQGGVPLNVCTSRNPLLRSLLGHKNIERGEQHSSVGGQLSMLSVCKQEA